jgi:hypothetical protein
VTAAVRVREVKAIAERVSSPLRRSPAASRKKRSGPGSRLAGVRDAVGIEMVQAVDAVPVPAPDPAVLGVVANARRGRGGALIGSVAPPVQAAVVAAGGFVAGAAIVGLAGRRRGKRGGRASAKGRRGARTKNGARGELVRIVGTRSLLVDVHLLGGAER